MSSEQKLTKFLQAAEQRQQHQQASYQSLKRIGQLVDPQSFVELDSAVTSRGLNYGFSREPVTGDGVVTGYATVNGQLVYLAAQEPTVYGGSLGEMHAAKIVKAIDLAVRADVPFIGLYDSGGSRIEEGVVSLDATGALLDALQDAQNSIPVISAICGPCAGSLAMIPEFSDFTFMNRANGGVFMNGPMIVQATENKAVDAAALGGGSVQAQAGVASFVYDAEEDMLQAVGSFVQFLMGQDAGDDPNRAEDALNDLAAALDRGFDADAAVRLIADLDQVYPIWAEHAPGVYTALAQLDGEVVGFAANQAERMDAAMALKLTRFVKLCERFGFPLITLSRCEGFVISSDAESQGMALAAGQLLRAFASCSVERINIIVGPVYGPGWQVMNSVSSGADLTFAWPTAAIAVVPVDTAATILYKDEIAQSDQPIEARKELGERYANELASPEFAAKLGYVDELIAPKATRPRLISALSMLF